MISETDSTKDTSTKDALEEPEPQPNPNGGPRTHAGRERSAQNATKHGFYSAKVVLANESQDDFNNLLASYLDEWQPATQTEADLVTEMAIHRWRFIRAVAKETAAIDSEMFVQRDEFEACYSNKTAQMRHADAFSSMNVDCPPVVDNLHKWETRYSRGFQRAMTHLIALQKRRTQREDIERARRRTAGPPPEAVKPREKPEPPGPQLAERQAPAEKVGNEPPAAPPVPSPLLCTAPEPEVFYFDSRFTRTTVRHSTDRREWLKT